MALIPTIAALALGGWLGMRWGGMPSNVLEWRPTAWIMGLSGLSLLIVTDLAGLTGSLGVLARLISLGLLLAFSVLNIRTGGMILVIIGLGLNFLVTLFNWGMPVSGSAIVSAGIVDDAAALDSLTLTGGHKLSEGGISFLGNVIPLPWGQVISIGDIIWLAGLVLVTASVLRRYEVRSVSTTPASYTRALSALNRGPAPRHGPGLHPSRMGEKPSRGSERQ